jgi:hypothetical protein
MHLYQVFISGTTRGSRQATKLINSKLKLEKRIGKGPPLSKKRNRHHTDK